MSAEAKLYAATVAMIDENRRLRVMLEAIKEYAAAHHDQEETHVWLHSLTVDIPAQVDQAERAQFEKTATAAGMNIDRHKCHDGTLRGYIVDATHHAWWGWQEATRICKAAARAVIKEMQEQSSTCKNCGEKQGDE